MCINTFFFSLQVHKLMTIDELKSTFNVDDHSLGEYECLPFKYYLSGLRRPCLLIEQVKLVNSQSIDKCVLII